MSGKKLKRTEFYKVHSAGNDFIIIEDDGSVSSPGERAKILCRRKVGIGSDGLILYAIVGESTVSFRFFNPDGSEAEICGNGVIALGTFLTKIVRLPHQRFTLQTKAGLKVFLLKNDFIYVNLGKPGFLLEDGTKAAELINHPIRLDDREVKINYVNVGNPHCSMFVDDLDFVDMARDGRLLEESPIFPNRTNVEFIQLIDRKNIIARFWERGAGYTLASGSGASAAAVISIVHEYCTSPVIVHTEIGRLEVFWKPGSSIVLKGQGTVVYRGELGFDV